MFFMFFSLMYIFFIFPILYIYIFFVYLYRVLKMGNKNGKEEDVWMAPGFINQFYKESFFVNLFLVHGEG